MLPIVALCFGFAAIATVANATAAKDAVRKLGGSNGEQPTAVISVRKQADEDTAVVNEPIAGGTPRLA